MCENKYLFFLITLSLVLPVSVFSKFIDINEINFNFSSIQVGIFKEKENILSIEHHFPDEDFYIYNLAKFDKLYMVNINSDQLEEKLYEIRKKFPDAFISTKSISKKLKNKKIKQVTVENHNINQDKTPLILDSKSILLTRKKII